MPALPPHLLRHSTRNMSSTQCPKSGSKHLNIADYFALRRIPQRLLVGLMLTADVHCRWCKRTRSCVESYWWW